MSTLPDANEGEVAELPAEGGEGRVVEVGGKNFGLNAIAIMDDYFPLHNLAWHISWVRVFNSCNRC